MRKKYRLVMEAELEVDEEDLKRDPQGWDGKEPLRHYLNKVLYAGVSEHSGLVNDEAIYLKGFFVRDVLS